MINMKDYSDKLAMENTKGKDARDFAIWLATDEGQQYLSEQMDNDIQTGSISKVVENVPTSEMFDSILKQIRVQRHKKVGKCCLASILPLLIMGCLFWIYGGGNSTNMAQMENIYVPKGESRTISFHDGSSAHLNSDSRIMYPKKFRFRNRQVFLIGEAYFDISKNKFRPFVVNLQNSKVTVLGTKFDVKAYPEEESVTVGLESGKVIFSTDTEVNVELKPGEIVSYNEKNLAYSIWKSDNVTDMMLWTKNVLHFENTPLSDVLGTLTRLYGISFNVIDSAAYRYNYTLSTSYGDVDATISELDKISPVRFRKDENTYIITVD